MGFLRKTTTSGLMDVIRCDEPSYLIWKWRPDGREANDSRTNAIRWGSSLRVKEGSVAVFVYSQDNGIQQEYIEGPYDDVIDTKNFPVLASIVGLLYKGGTPFQAEVYFINLAQIIQLKFAVPFFDVFDPRFLDYGVPVAVRGTISFKISDYKEFVRLHRLDTFTMDEFQNQVKDAICRYVKGVVANVPEEDGVPVVQLERRIDRINEIVEGKIQERLRTEFGVTVSSVDIAAIEVDKSSDGYQQLKSVTQDLTTATMKAQTEVEIKEMRDNQKLGVLGKAARGLVDVKENGYARHLMSKKTNGTFQQTPPPISGALYNVAVNGQATGPYDKATIEKMIERGDIKKDTLLWTEGMAEWEECVNCVEFKQLFHTKPDEMMPPIPNA